VIFLKPFGNYYETLFGLARSLSIPCLFFDPDSAAIELRSAFSLEKFSRTVLVLGELTGFVPRRQSVMNSPSSSVDLCSGKRPTTPVIPVIFFDFFFSGGSPATQV